MGAVGRILIVDDEVRFVESLQRLLEAGGHLVQAAVTAQTAMDHLQSASFDVCLLDIGLPKIDGFELLEHIRQHWPAIPVVMMTGLATVESAVKALQQGAYDYLRKPFEQADLFHTIRNALERKKLLQENRAIHEKLRLSEARYRYLVQHSPDIIYTLDAQGQVTFINEAAVRLLGRPVDQIIGRPFLELIHPEDRTRAETILQSQANELLDQGGIEVRLQKGEREDAPCYCEIIHFVIHAEDLSKALFPPPREHVQQFAVYGVARDVSYRRQLEYQLSHAQKMEMMGTLSGGIAHDFNNILMGIQGYTSLLMMDMRPDDQQYAKLLNVESLVQSGTDLTRQLLTLDRGGQCNVKPLDINKLLRKTATMFGRTKKEIMIHTSFCDRLWAAEADEGQMKQVLLNLYVNAWQSMPSGGDLYLKTANVVLRPPEAAKLGLAAGQYVKIAVTDTGIGMDKALQERIFEPFFTTKPRGQGTGLGLASAYGIVQRHKGLIRVSSRKNKGSTFLIYLTASTRAIEQECLPQKRIIDGHGTVLLVDDEENVIEVTRQMLVSLGYQVLTASSGHEAVDIFSQTKDRIDLLILDMIMPKMDGGATYDCIKEIRPDVKVLLSSGYSMQGEAEKIIQRGCNGFIQKPFSLEELSQAVKQLCCANGGRA